MVDNASTDDTPQVVDSFQGRLPVSRLAHDQPGLSLARNVVLEQALQQDPAGRLIFVDDDVTTPPGWLNAYQAGFDRYPDAAFWGGPIRSVVSGGDPWVIETVKTVMPGVLSHLQPDLGEQPLETAKLGIPWGANFALRLSAVGSLRFDPTLGRSPERPFAIGEETTMVASLTDAGYYGAWLPAVELLHHVSGERCDRDAFSRYCYQVGYYFGRRDASNGGPAPDALRARMRSLYRQAAYWALRPGVRRARQWEALRDWMYESGYCAGVRTYAGKH